jgi:bifunctional non-homologous end joining protein LigD
LVEAARVALALGPRVEQLGLQPYAKTSGGLGLHVHAPLAEPLDTKRVAKEVAEALAEERPDELVAEMRRSARPGRVFVDWLQNDVTRQTVAPYSLRGLPHPTVATPVGWEEVERAAEGETGALVLTPADVLARVERDGDLFAPLL